MASPTPNSSSASVSRSKTSRDKVKSDADALLRASLTGGLVSPPSSASISRSRSRPDIMPTSSSSPKTSSASVSRSTASKEQVRSLADEMLRASISRNGASPASVSRATARKDTGKTSRTSLFDPRGASRHASSSLSSTILDNPPPAYSPAEDTANTAKIRKHQLQSEVDLANASAPERNTSGLFRKACSTDLLFLIDTTYSMEPYIESARKQVKSIVADIKQEYMNESDVRIAVVSYKDHQCQPNIEFLDFTQSTDAVHRFLDRLSTDWGRDFPEDVLGGVWQALQASWQHQTRIVIHIGDAPPHGRGLHDFNASADNFHEPGSEPHRLTYEPLLTKLVQLNINYTFLRITKHTDRMAVAFATCYGHKNTTLSPDNTHRMQVQKEAGKSSGWSTTSQQPQFVEAQLGTTYSAIRKLVVRSVTNSVSRSATRLSAAMGRTPAVGFSKKPTYMSAIREDSDSAGTNGSSGPSIPLETTSPQWHTPGWLDERLEVEGFCPAAVVHNANTLQDMMAADENIKLSVVELTTHVRSKPFAKGAMRVAKYARTAASTNRFVIKSFIKAGQGRAAVAEDMLMLVLCKAFALEFNGLLKIEPPLDFVVSSILQPRASSSGSAHRDKECLSLEPYLPGDYVKYNNNGGWVNEDLANDPFNQQAQAFSHFTFERSWGHFLVSDLQGVGHLLTDPAIQTKAADRFKLNDTNMNEEGFKFFFATHKCNSYCSQLGLKTEKTMLISGNWSFRETWPTMDPTVCCSNKLCRSIIRLANAHKSEKFPGYHWCDTCWPQLESSTVRWVCTEPGEHHEFDASRFFFESQGEIAPKKCPDHREEDPTQSSAAAVGGSLWNRMKSTETKGTISGKVW